MRRSWLLLGALALAGASGVADEEEKMKLGADGKALFLVSKPGATSEALAAALRDLGLESSILGDLKTAQVPATIVRTDAAGASACKAHGLTVRADKWTKKLSSLKFSPLAPWGLDRIDQPTHSLDGLYVSPHGGAGATLIVVDAGVDASHAAFAGRQIFGLDFTGDSQGDHLDDCDGHGTHVAATAAGRDFGVAPLANIISLKVCSCDDGCSELAFAYSLMFTLTIPYDKKVMLLPLGGPDGFMGSAADFAEDLRVLGEGGIYAELFELLAESNVTTIAAAGNDNADACFFGPGAAPMTINVGATGRNDRLAPFTNWGPCVDIFAPGVEVLSAKAGRVDGNKVNGKEKRSGTSMAAAHVAGVALQIAAAYDTSDPLVIRAQILALAARGTLDEDRERNELQGLVPGRFPVTRVGGPPHLLQALTDPLPPLATSAPKPSATPNISVTGAHNLTLAVLGDEDAYDDLWVRVYRVDTDLTHEIALEQNGGFSETELFVATAMVPAGNYTFVAYDYGENGYEPRAIAFHALYVDGTPVHQAGGQFQGFSDVVSFTIEDAAAPVCCPVGCIERGERRRLDDAWHSRRSLLFGSFARTCPPGCVPTA